MMEQTLAIIKPDAVAAKNAGKIIDLIEHNGFSIDRMEKGILKSEQAEAFYAVHKEKPFFGELVEFLCSGPIVVMALSKENAIADWRTLMGATDSKKAEKGTIRNLFGTDIGKNATHGSDSPETAAQELGFFFGE
jgi:nucleoside-diphosphate kinase